MSKNTKYKKEKASSIDTFFEFFGKHLFIFVPLLCLLLLPLGLAQAEQITDEGIIIEAIIIIAASLAFVAFARPTKNKAASIGLIISFVVLTVLFSLLTGYDGKYSTVMFVPVTAGLILTGAMLYKEKALNAEGIVLMMIVLGVVVRYCYCLKYNCTQMQHDTGSFGGSSGHESYIMYWYKNGLALPDFDVTTRWQYYHPPLHHMLMALGMRIFTTFGIPLKQAEEAIQILPMIYSSLCMVVCRRIFKLVKLEGTGLVVAMAAVCFYPTFIIWSGAYNNDMLATLFMLLAMMWTIKWYYKPSFKNILPIAVCVGCGMMTKLSAWMVAPGIALIFIWVFVRNIRKPLPYIGQFAAFGAVCAPLGLWWGVRNMFEFGILITYVPDPSMQQMSVRSIPAAQRLFDYSLSQFDYPFEAFTMYNAPYNEYNPFIGLLKTSIFDEYNKGWDFSEMATVFVIISGLLALISIVCLVLLMFRKDVCGDLPVKLFFMVVFLTIIVSYTAFCFKFPYVCTENIRYCIPVIPILAMALGFGIMPKHNSASNQHS